jgi:hypothetical protein
LIIVRCIYLVNQKVFHFFEFTYIFGITKKLYYSCQHNPRYPVPYIPITITYIPFPISRSLYPDYYYLYTVPYIPITYIHIPYIPIVWNYVICENKKNVFRTRDANSSINIMKLTSCWIEKQERPLCFQIPSFTSSSIKTEERKVRPS